MPALVQPKGSQDDSTWRFGLLLLEAQQLGPLGDLLQPSPKLKPMPFGSMIGMSSLLASSKRFCLACLFLVMLWPARAPNKRLPLKGSARGAPSDTMSLQQSSVKRWPQHYCKIAMLVGATRCNIHQTQSNLQHQHSSRASSAQRCLRPNARIGPNRCQTADAHDRASPC